MKKIILFIALLSTFLANAQWQTDTTVNTLASNTVSGDSQSVATSTGGTFIVYYKSVPSPVNFEIWVQYLDVNGMKVFGDNGMLITNTLPMSTYSVTWKVVVDGKDNLYVAVTGTGTGSPGYVYKVTPAGEILWNLNVGSGYVLNVLPLADYSVLISYMPAAGGKGKIMKYDELGVPLWTNPIDVAPDTPNATKATVVADMFEQSNGYFTAVFHIRQGFGVNSLLYAQRYNSAGMPQWTEPTQLADKGSTYNNLSYGGVQDGDIIYYGYSLSTVSRFDAFAQRINTDGTIPWGINGVDFDTNATNYELNAKIAFQPGSQYIWMVSSYTPSTQGTYGEYVQKFDKVTGARQFTNNAHEVYPIDSNSRVHAGNLYIVNDRPLFALKSGMDNGVSATTLKAQFLDANGNSAVTDIIPLATFAANKGRVVLNKPVNNQGVITFAEQKISGQLNMYAQNFPLVTACTVTPVALADVTSACSVAFTGLTVPALNDSCGNPVTVTTDQSIFPVTQNTTITWTYTAASGTVATQTQNIIISNVLAPAALAAITSQCAVAVTDLTVPVITDACGNTVTPTTDASIFPLTAGTTTITWTYTSSTGAIATQTQNITVTNTAAPVLIVQNVSAALTEGGAITVTASDFNNGSTNGCGGSNDTSSWTWTVTPASFTCDDLGEQTVTITATDANGNVFSTTATVTVTDPDNYCLAGTEHFGKQPITLYPNPANDIFTINSPDAIQSVTVYDMLGKIVFSSTTLSTNPTVDVKSWSAGIYHVSTEDLNGNLQRFKLVRK